jgi:hypothetical protein
MLPDASTSGVNSPTENFSEWRLILCGCHERTSESGSVGIDITGGVRAGIRTRRKV